MFSNEELSQFALNELPHRPTKKPWMTAAALVTKIQKNQNIQVREEVLEKALENESRLQGRRIRYSMYPSARSLKILWGAISSVEDRNLPSIVLDNGDEQKESSTPLANDKHIVFISHNYKDKKSVMILCEEMEKAGIPTWIFENRIQEGETIINEVRNAIVSAPICILYLSKNSIGSTWVRKEIMNVRGGVRLVVNASYKHLLTYLAQLKTPPREIPENLLRKCKTENQRNSARALLTYIYDCFIRENHTIYIHGHDTELCNINELITEIELNMEIRHN